MEIHFDSKSFDCDAIAFDKDGTLTDSQQFWQGLYDTRCKLVNESEGEVLALEWTRMIGVDAEQGIIDHYGPLAAATTEQEMIVLAACLYRFKHYPWDEAMHKASQIFSEAEAHLQPKAYTTPLPGVPEVLLELARRGFPMAVVTLDNAPRTHRVLLHLGLTQAIRCVVCPEDVLKPKPAPDMLMKVAQVFNVDPKRIAMVGDSRTDMLMAQAVGAIAVHITDNDKNSIDPDIAVHASIHSIAEISIQPSLNQ